MAQKSNKISRRKALAAGTASAGIMIGGSCGNTPEQQKTRRENGPWTVLDRKPFWEPGPNKNLDRGDLTPGTTPIRLGGFLGPRLRQRKTIGIEGAVLDLVKNGYRGCHVDQETVHELSDSDLRELNAALEKHDVLVYEVGGYQNMLDPNEETRQKNLAYLCSALEAAEKVNCPMVGTCTGSRDPQYYIGVHPDNWTEETWQLTVDAVKQVLRDTSGLKAALGIEAQVTMNLDGPKAHRRLIDDVGDPRCAVNLDPVNMISLSNYYHTTELLHECFDLLGETILGAHAKDTYIWPDQQTVHVQEVCPGRGVMDYETYLVLLSRMEWPRTLLPEHIPDDQYAEANAYIKKIAEKMGVEIMG